MSTVNFTNPPSISKPPGYTHVVEITGPGKLIYITGQLGLEVGLAYDVDRAADLVVQTEEERIRAQRPRINRRALLLLRRRGRPRRRHLLLSGRAHIYQVDFADNSNSASSISAIVCQSSV